MIDRRAFLGLAIAVPAVVAVAKVAPEKKVRPPTEATYSDEEERLPWNGHIQEIWSETILEEYKLHLECYKDAMHLDF